jgi:hypothetical protein
MSRFTPIYKVFIPYNEQKKFNVEIYENKYKPSVDYFYIKDIFAEFTLDKEIKERTGKIVPSLCTQLTNQWTETWLNEWIPKNLKIQVDTLANKFMRDNIESIVYRHITENSDIMNIMSNHLKSVEETVDNEINKKIQQIIETDAETNPVIQYQMKYLEDIYKKKIDVQNTQILELTASVNNLNRDNVYLKHRIQDTDNNIIYIWSIGLIFGCMIVAGIATNRRDICKIIY